MCTVLFPRPPFLSYLETHLNTSKHQIDIARVFQYRRSKFFKSFIAALCHD